MLRPGETLRASRQRPPIITAARGTNSEGPDTGEPVSARLLDRDFSAERLPYLRLLPYDGQLPYLGRVTLHWDYPEGIYGERKRMREQQVH